MAMRSLYAIEYIACVTGAWVKGLQNISIKYKQRLETSVPDNLDIYGNRVAWKTFRRRESAVTLFYLPVKDWTSQRVGRQNQGLKNDDRQIELLWLGNSRGL